MGEAIVQEYGTGYHAAASTERQVLVTGRAVKASGKYPVITIGGWGGVAPGYLPWIADSLLAAGCAQGAADLVDGKQWGNDASTDRVESLRALLVSRLGAKSSKVLLSAGSHGTCIALNYARRFPTKVAAMSLALPAVDVQDIHDNNRASSFGVTQAQMESVHGGSSSAFSTSMLTRNPINFTSSLAGIPMLLFASTDDPVCLYSKVQAFATACPSATIVNCGANGHSTGTNPALTAQANDFLKSYA